MRVLECFLNSLVLHFGLCLYLKEDPDFVIGGVTANLSLYSENIFIKDYW